MKLKEFIENLNEFVKENPETLDMEVVTSIDDEGNGYSFVHYTPSKGVYEDVMNVVVLLIVLVVGAHQ